MSESTKLPKDAAHMMREAFYVAVGLGVMGAQKVQARRHELAGRLSNANETIAGRLSSANETIGKGVQQITPMANDLAQKAQAHASSVVSQVQDRLNRKQRD
jgi:hypothetical protein